MHPGDRSSEGKSFFPSLITFHCVTPDGLELVILPLQASWCGTTAVYLHFWWKARFSEITTRTNTFLQNKVSDAKRGTLRVCHIQTDHMWWCDKMWEPTSGAWWCQLGMTVKTWSVETLRRESDFFSPHSVWVLLETTVECGNRTSFCCSHRRFPPGKEVLCDLPENEGTVFWERAVPSDPLSLTSWGLTPMKSRPDFTYVSSAWKPDPWLYENDNRRQPGLFATNIADCRIWT